MLDLLYNLLTSNVKFFSFDKIIVKSFLILFSFVFSVSKFSFLSFIIFILVDSDDIFGYSIQTFCSFDKGFETIPVSFNN